MGTYSRWLKVEGALIEYQSLRVKGSWVLFLRLRISNQHFPSVAVDAHADLPFLAFRQALVLANSHDCDEISGRRMVVVED